MKIKVLCLFVVVVFFACKDSEKNHNPARQATSDVTYKMDSVEAASVDNMKVGDSIPVMPVHHASFVIRLNHKNI